MEIISRANEAILAILKKFRKIGSGYRLMKYCIEMATEEGVMLFNQLSRELILLTPKEYASVTENSGLRERWFVVPDDTNERELVDLVRWMSTTRNKPLDKITKFSILPTTDCNARCFYCFEKGCSRTSMNEETAQKVVHYIKKHDVGEKVQLAWFGGEPLFNQPAIDIICQGLLQENVDFFSTMVSNGYLFDDETVHKAVKSWNLKNVQITLDGTEEVYNRSKAYIYKEGSPYQVVLGNIQRLLDASVPVVVRLNLDLHNAKNLLELVDELASRFHGETGLTVYGYHLFDKENPQALLHSEEGWQKRSEAMQCLENKIRHYDLDIKYGVPKTLKVNHCMADCGYCVTILPTGNIGLCDHHTEDEFIGHVDQQGFDVDIVMSWQEQIPGSPDCGDCAYYPSCIVLKKCTSNSICFERFRQERRRIIQRQMEYEYQCWQAQTAPKELEYGERC